jgi:HEAT repeat protein
MTDLQSILNDLQQPDPAVRLPAIYALTESGNPLAVDALRRLLWDDSKVATHAATIRALGQLGGDRALEPLIRALKHDHATVRDTAAQALGDMGDPRAVDPLTEVLQTGQGMLRATAAESLGKLGDGRAVDALIRALDDERADVRFAAAGALGQLGDARAVNPLIAALDDPAVIYGGAVCEAAAEALQRIGTPEAQAAVEKWHAVWDVISGASVESLIESLRHDLWEVRHSAAYMLGEMKDARAVDPLIAALDEPDLDVRTAAARALGKLGDPRAVGRLIDLLGEPDVRLRRAVIEALGRLRDARAVDPLVALLDVADADLDFAAAEALARIGGKPAQQAIRAWQKRLEENPRFPPERQGDVT